MGHADGARAPYTSHPIHFQKAGKQGRTDGASDVMVAIASIPARWS